MTKTKFQRIHPDVTVNLESFPDNDGNTKWRAIAFLGGDPIASTWGRSEGKALTSLSRLAYRAKSIIAKKRSGHRDANTGELGDLETHHITRRSKGLDHSLKNLAPVTRRTHRRQPSHS